MSTEDAATGVSPSEPPADASVILLGHVVDTTSLLHVLTGMMVKNSPHKVKLIVGYGFCLY